jgi:hypothetical protein
MQRRNGGQITDKDGKWRGIEINPALLGTAVGFGAACFFLPGGYDALRFYLHAPTAETTAPAWVYLLTYPLGLFPWPWGWAILTTVSVYLAGLRLSSVFPASGGGKWWWVAVFGAPLVWNIWLGQIEVFPVAGLLLSGLVWKRRLHPLWLGLAWLGLLTKPQVGAGLLLIISAWVWQEQGKKAIFWAGLSAMGVILLTLALWPGWLFRWVAAVRALQPGWWNAALWPYGLAALPLAFLPLAMPPERRLRMVGAATLLSSPYFALYHCLTLTTLADTPLALAFSWLPVILGATLGGEWMKWGWLLPVSMLIMDVLGIIKERRLRRA